MKSMTLLMSAVALLLLLLIVLLVAQLGSPAEQAARNSRTAAVKSLLSQNGGDADISLRQITNSLTHPVLPGGSIYNLNHYLSGDPGRREFRRPSDRRRFRSYMTEDMLAEIRDYTENSVPDGVPSWMPEFAATVRVLFDQVQDEVLSLCGVPAELTGRPVSGGLSVNDRTETAIAAFADQWIPAGQRAWTPDRSVIRRYLLDSRRFRRRMEEMDQGWNELIVSLYNLSVSPRWREAALYDPKLQSALDQLTIAALCADIYSRERDLMRLVPGASAGIIWQPDYAFYKNIPELTGMTSDTEPVIFMVKVSLGYVFGDRQTQTWLNQRKDWLTDYFNRFFSDLKSAEIALNAENSAELVHWKSAWTKASAIHHINQNIAAEVPMSSQDVQGVRELALVRVNLVVSP